jgi:hypothetical protein
MPTSLLCWLFLVQDQLDKDDAMQEVLLITYSLKSITSSDQKGCSQLDAGGKETRKFRTLSVSWSGN